MDYNQILFVAIGLYTIIRGIMILTTGKISAREEAKLHERKVSEKGIRKYKMLSAGMNLIGGLVVVICCALRMLAVIDMTTFRIIALIAIALMLILYFLIYNSCMNDR